MTESDKKGLRSLTKGLIILSALSFIGTTIGLILQIVTGGNFHEYFVDEEGGSNIVYYQISFWILIVSSIVYLMSGGNFSKFMDQD